jgi:tripartite-type tricarboxylate transporter receptor subunit TctC
VTDIRISRRTALMGGVLATAALSARSALAQQYPSRPIRWLVGYPPGGGTDVLARLLAGAMSPQLGQQLFIENRPGAATNVATEAAVRAEPDGYTVATAGIETLVYNPILYKKLPFDPARELRPVGLSARLHLLLTVKRDSPATSARDFIERARTAPGKIDYGSPGLGSPHHLVMERLMRETGIKLTHVPYRGMAPVITDMLGGSWKRQSSTMQLVTAFCVLGPSGLWLFALRAASKRYRKCPLWRRLSGRGGLTPSRGRDSLCRRAHLMRSSRG